ncbi:terminase [Mangrovihabitans endophyticus]|uniref:Terminase n=1 Tax=Mangrovihabitans endophyticus TaxID=1751298 RepID=A0A8J3FN61_9ACTN|nr:terminase [Mangrovihabitans endophyticus]GGK89287.1 terminase [Mangrovihabitans endophyticus]
MTTTATSEERPAGYREDPWYGTRAWVSLPWPQDQDAKDRLIRNSLGPLVIDWAEGRGDGPGLINYQSGGQWQYTPGQKRFLILWYAFDPATGRFVYRRGAKRGAKGTGKDPFGGSICNAELVGPTQLVPDGRGGWTGEPHGMPLVQIASNSEAQSKDVLRVANAMFSKDARSYYDLDCGETRTIIRGSGGRTEVLTASESSAEGDPATFVFLNETHHMTESSGGHRVARVVRRNVGKSPAELQARVLDGTNAHAQGGDSVAERTYTAWQAQVAGQAKRRDILYDSIEAPPDTDLFDDASRRAGLEAAYADAPWADLERLDGEVLDPETPVADSIRYYLNGLAAAEDAWVEPRKFDALARADVVVADNSQIAMFLDCSKSGDATGLVGCRLSDGHVFTLGCWQRPRGNAGEGWLAPREEVDGAVRWAFDRFRVEWFGVDPSPARDDESEALYWMPMADAWHRDFHRRLKVWATGGAKVGSAVLFDMRIRTPGGIQRNQRFTQAAMQTAADIDEHGALSWDGDTRLRTHVHQAKRRTNPWGVSLGKVTRDSDKHVDLAVCMVGARMGRRLALNSGKVRQRSGKASF